MKDINDLLNLPDEIDQQILRYQYEITGLRGRLLPGSMTYDKERVQAQGVPLDKMPEIMGRINELEQKINGLKKKKKEAINNIKNMAEKLQENQRTVILGYYVAGCSIKKIAKDMGYSVKRVYQFRKAAIIELNKRVKKLNINQKNA